MHGAESDQIGCGKNSVEGLPTPQQLTCRQVPGLFGGNRVDAHFRQRACPRLLDRRRVSSVALEKFGIVVRGMAEKRQAPATVIEQMFRRIESTLEIVAADGNAGLSFQDRSPAHEMRA